ncbi:MAG: hypothetical protein ABJG41_20765 [Cyclobacteriaceae bacterium]
MMTKLLQKGLLIVTLVFLYTGVIAQSDTTMVFDPATIPVDETGYWTVGADKVIEECGPNPVHFDGCDDAYGDSDQREEGVVDGWEYGRATVFYDCHLEENMDATCTGSADKYPHDEIEGWSETESDFIMLGKHKYYETDSAFFGFIITPPFTNLKSLNITTSGDISRQENTRELVYLIEASFDGGVTWEYNDKADGDAWLEHIMNSHAGDIATFEDGDGDFGFQAIVDGSKDADSTMLRISSFPYIPKLDRTPNGQRINVWEVVVEAQTVPKVAGDSDNDGVADDVDLCADTPAEAIVDADGCAKSQKDTDTDGVTDDIDECPGTSAGAIVDSKGCADDQTPLGTVVPDANFFRITNGEFISTDTSELSIYNFSGKLIGRGLSIVVPTEGLYIIKNDEGKTQKIFLK